MNETAYNALRTQAAYIDATGRGNIRVIGEDRVRLLHAMTTNHIENLMPGTGCYAFFLSSQGRILADANIFCLPDHLLIDTEIETSEKVRQHLDKYIIADDVVLEDFTNSIAVINVEGPESQEVVTRLGCPTAHLPYTIAEWHHGTIAHVSTTGAPGYSIMLPREHKQALIAELSSVGVPEANSPEVEAVRLEYGKPKYGVDFSESNIPQETQLLHALHWSKGCYLGQEIVERVRSRGHVNKLLVQLEIDTTTPPPKGAKVLAGDAPSGDVTSSAFIPSKGVSLAFAIVRAEALQSILTVDGASGRVRPAAK